MFFFFFFFFSFEQINRDTIIDKWLFCLRVERVEARDIEWNEILLSFLFFFFFS